MTLTPAYGRAYRKQADILSDFNANLDFLLHDPMSHGVPINKEQIPAGTFVQFLYGPRLEKVLGHQVTK